MFHRIWKFIDDLFSRGIRWMLLPFSVFLAVFTLSWIVFVMILWPAENNGTIREEIALEQCDFEIVKPKIVPGDHTVTLQISWTGGDSCFPPIVDVDVQVPRELEIVDPQPQEYNHLKLFLEKGKIYSINLKNTRLVPWIKDTKQIFLSTDAQEKPLEIEMEIEGNLRTILLRYGTQEFPFIPLISLFLAIMTFYQDTVVKQQEIQERERKEKREHAQHLMEQMREAFISADIGQAQNILRTLEEKLLIPEMEAPYEVETARRLLQVAQGKFDVLPQPFPPSGWEEEAAGALIDLAEHHSRSPELSFLIRTFPEDRLRQNKERFEQVKKKFLEFPLRERSWPVLPSPPKLPEVGKFLIPFFPQGVAESEEAFLFSEAGLFYTDHPLYRQLQNETGLCFVTGDPGSGRTALGLAFGRYHLLESERNAAFGCYLPRIVTARELQQVLTARLLEFIESNPSQLALWSREQYRMGAALLCAGLGKQAVLARLSAILFQESHSQSNATGNKNESIQESHSQSDATGKRNEAISEAEKVRRDVELTQIRMLLEACRSTEERPLPDHEWPAMLVTCLNQTGFRHFYLVFDLKSSYSISWHETVFLPFWLTFTLWPESSRFHAIVLTQDKALPEMPGVATFSLEWSTEELKKLLVHRWAQTRQGPFLNIFEGEDVLQLLLTQANGNPRRLLKMVWNLFHHDSPPFSKTHVLRHI
ncbi:MAG: hypothetical protein J7555_03105 [Chloroflexi bacterium]|nr:hypothetical protein [Chloroflexota bacterium]